MSNTPTVPLPQSILIIDDDPDLIETLADSLELVGHFRVVRASDGRAGLEAAVAQRPDCVVVDVRMPHLNGMQFVRAMRGDAATAHIPIIMLSALIQDRDVQLGFLSGADAYLRKPVRIHELLAAIQSALRVTQEQRVQALVRLSERED
ncbi:MAG: response regulator [Ktedonobacterales bacterium]|nr:response regulator [Ktedonobacterales bacterium]